ncbi:MAG: hypothetical protein MRZ79_13255 [Bacteroidia bacterium]|nr:hypothetical protein [Bacteroidia bacterium]
MLVGKINVNGRLGVIWGFLGMLTLLGSVHAQGVKTYELHALPPFPDTLKLPQELLVPFSEKIKDNLGNYLPDSLYEISYDGAYILTHKDWKYYDEFFIQYSYFEQKPNKSISIRTYQGVLDTLSREINPDVIIVPSSPESEYFWPEAENIRKSGSLTQGLTVGNSQSIGVNSGIQLQLEGDLGGGLEIVGAITDNNVPIQPDGSTQQISDFDKIFVNLSKGPWSTTIGDFEVFRKQSAFANFYRNVQGLQASYKDEKSRVLVSGAVAKGRFHTNTIPGKEGISGPYQLTGRNNERFFLVLAGSEKVYLNGKLMTRGENNDYVINYNTAELTFTPRHVITNITRIVIDFEYTELAYNRSLITVQAEQKLLRDRLDMRFSFVRDGDNPNAPFDTTSFQAALNELQNAGDQNPVFTSGITRVPDGSGQGRYERRDTTVFGQLFEYYRFTRDSLAAQYRITFSNVGQGNGNYILDPSVNGTNFFVWVGPDSLGIPKGNFEPIRQWVLPRLLQVADLQLDYQLANRINLYSETALSNQDENRLSRVGDDDNIDLASRNGIRGKKIPVGDSLYLSFDLNHQYVGQRYTNLDRLYKAEYGRIWNFDEADVRRNEHLGQYKLDLNFQDNLFFHTEGGLRYTGRGRINQRQVYELRSKRKGWTQGNFRYTRIQTQNDSLRFASSWDRYEGDVFQPIKKWKLGSEIWIERQENTMQDSILNSSFRFTDLKPYLRSQGFRNFDLNLSYNFRRDEGLINGEWKEKSTAYTWYLQGNWKPSPAISLQPTFALRELRVGDSLFRAEGLEDSRIINMNLKGRLAPKKRWVFANFLYEVNSEQLAKREVRYIRVNPGQGTHIWLDSLFNNDGIPDLEEFQPAINPLTADFLQVVVPTRELIPTSRLSLTGLLRWDFRQVIKSDGKNWKEFFRQTRLTTNIRITQHKNRSTSINSYLINVGNPFSDTSLVSANYNIRQEISFFQNSRKGDIRFFYLSNQNKLFLATGDELRGLSYIGGKFRLNLGQLSEGGAKSLEGELRTGQKFVQAVQFQSRNYDIDFIEIEPRFNLQLNRKLRLSSGLSFSNRQNSDSTAKALARVRSGKLSFEARWNIAGRNNVNAELDLVRVNQVGEADLAATLELRQGLQEGNNAIWRVFLTWFVLKNVELGFTYDGRVSAGIPVIHTGRLQARAFF